MRSLENFLCKMLLFIRYLGNEFTTCRSAMQIGEFQMRLTGLRTPKEI